MNTRGERVLAVDDDPDLLRLLSLRLKSAGFEVATANGGAQALAALAASRPQVVLTDLRMAGMDGIALFEAVCREYPGLPVIILTAHGTIPDAVAATQRGVFGYLEKPVDAQRLAETIRAALRTSAADQQGETDEVWRADMITRSPKMEAVLAKARQVAAGDAPVLILGESGTGKELLARGIHRASRRAGGPFVAINCGAIPENLLESELFGYVKGAFTGAARDHAGLFATAAGGTLLLDEIGDMPISLQVKLLRVLQEHEVRPLGATRPQPIDVRIVSATHRNLSEEMAQNRFRADLYYRLNVIALELPRLADRREDIPLLAQHHLLRMARQYGKDVHAFAPEAIERLLAASWPGNVRQLANVVEQVLVLSTTAIIPTVLVDQAIREADDAIASFEDARNRFEREYLVQLLKITAGNVSRAARLAKRNRTDFYKLLARHHLEAASFKSGTD
ncbi:MAG: two-component system response regulator GlrR [Betaproteobacteria bacterium HGW-Betaproteobacteria-14]|nr:MAG: two-component system response regulator GlrR [Betaproteobacteria bacterium HGW-Betaproteobacteria-14]